MNNTGSPMPSSHEREQAIFTLAVAKPAAERAAFLDRECAGDFALRQRLEALMAAHERPDPVLDAGTTESPHPASSHPLPSDERGTGGEGRSYASAGRPYFVMELVRGIRITDYCDQNNLSTVERLKLFILVCQAIQHAHQKGI